MPGNRSLKRCALGGDDGRSVWEAKLFLQKSNATLQMSLLSWAKMLCNLMSDAEALKERPPAVCPRYNGIIFESISRMFRSRRVKYSPGGDCSHHVPEVSRFGNSTIVESPENELQTRRVSLSSFCWFSF